MLDVGSRACAERPRPDGAARGRAEFLSNPDGSSEAERPPGQRPVHLRRAAGRRGSSGGAQLPCRGSAGVLRLRDPPAEHAGAECPSGTALNWEPCAADPGARGRARQGYTSSLENGSSPRTSGGQVLSVLEAEPGNAVDVFLYAPAPNAAGVARVAPLFGSQSAVRAARFDDEGHVLEALARIGKALGGHWGATAG
ncbi:unnamed protein product [Prorocentrum cordatum]|uniref:Uncharacterized protein n=1 Tax=Prorocentrum cordatum TaxID=2364126 RepID=A0ABN9UD23_9DINO|nr:unnamed protein product [Polarella glacialis]